MDRPATTAEHGHLPPPTHQEPYSCFQVPFAKQLPSETLMSTSAGSISLSCALPCHMSSWFRPSLASALAVLISPHKEPRGHKPHYSHPGSRARYRWSPQSPPYAECGASLHLIIGHGPSVGLLPWPRGWGVKAQARPNLTSKSSEEPGYRTGTRPDLWGHWYA